MTCKETSAAFRAMAEKAIGTERATTALQDCHSLMDVMATAIECATGKKFDTAHQALKGFIDYGESVLPPAIFKALAADKSTLARCGPLALAVTEHITQKGAVTPKPVARAVTPAPTPAPSPAAKPAPAPTAEPPRPETSAQSRVPTGHWSGLSKAVTAIEQQIKAANPNGGAK